MKMRVYETGADDFPGGIDQFIDATLEAFPNMNDFRAIERDDSLGDSNMAVFSKRYHRAICNKGRHQPFPPGLRLIGQRSACKNSKASSDPSLGSNSELMLGTVPRKHSVHCS